MITKDNLLQCSVANFTAFGSKRFTMDELASTLGISKKTIYKFYNSKEDLVVDSVSFLVTDFEKTVSDIITKQQDPLVCIIEIYKHGFERLKHFKPSFIFGLKKYYPKANQVFDAFRDNIVNNTIYGLLQQAQQKEFISNDVNLNLFCELYFNRFEEMAFKNNALFETYSNTELLNHFVIFNLKGISNKGYSNPYY
ncbi:TetR/AcrR family transcriptional regulator [Mangrovimonas spongiae]|uniref:TetR/AcrR family transcriptional regulator n=1 Tax=Mangrovimonas spongiae TaxID=2494697 RepID=A0A428K5I2_9FLAO|nr:TetR/AcrR family transcriptional regulator [Mangrovimonas spongiae]RSK41656.1 TetR/AcrR family transcriptional regulator [Mangrovimonas spongiae]